MPRILASAWCKIWQLNGIQRRWRARARLPRRDDCSLFSEANASLDTQASASITRTHARLSVCSALLSTSIRSRRCAQRQEEKSEQTPNASEASMRSARRRSGSRSRTLNKRAGERARAPAIDSTATLRAISNGSSLRRLVVATTVAIVVATAADSRSHRLRARVESSTPSLCLPWWTRCRRRHSSALLARSSFARALPPPLKLRARSGGLALAATLVAALAAAAAAAATVAAAVAAAAADRRYETRPTIATPRLLDLVSSRRRRHHCRRRRRCRLCGERVRARNRASDGATFACARARARACGARVNDVRRAFRFISRRRRRISSVESLVLHVVLGARARVYPRASSFDTRRWRSFARRGRCARAFA